MEDTFRMIVPPIALFLTMGLPFSIAAYKFKNAHINRITFFIGSLVLLLTGFLDLSGFLVWVPITIYAIICGLRANDIKTSGTANLIFSLIAILLFFAWPYLAIANTHSNDD